MTAEKARVSDLMQSGRFDGQTDDRLKDEDNVAWVMLLPAQVRDDWLTTLEWGRVADRLIESAEFGDGAAAGAFADFQAEWTALRSGDVPPASQFGDLFARLAERWGREQLSAAALRRWDLHLDALWRYRRPDRVILTAADYRQAMHDLSGTFFQACPYQPDGLADAVSALGALDQFFNNLRDLYEDTVRGICYFPPDLLDRFGIGGSELTGLLDRVDVRLERLFGHLLSTVVAELRLQASPLFEATGLHPSWPEMLHSVTVRHSRIEYTARVCRFNAAAFAERYWPLAADDLRPARLSPL